MRGLEREMRSSHTVWYKLLAVAMPALLAVCMFALTGCGNDNSSSSSDEGEFADLDPVTIILADCASPGSSGNLWSEDFAKRVNELTKGKITVDYHGNSELGGDVDLLRQEQSNDIQMVCVQPAPMVSFIPELAAFDLPMAFAQNTPEQIDTVLNGSNEFTQDLQSAYEKGSLHNLGFLQDGTYRLTTSNKDLQSLEDFKGFQIRTMENKNHMAFWQALGAEPTPLAFSEVYFALQNGTVDGQENAADTIVGASLQEVQKYLAKTNHILYTYNMSINKDFWEGLDPAYQNAITQAISESAGEIKGQLKSLDEDSIQTIKDAGATIIEYDDDFYDSILALEGVKNLQTDISNQTNGLSDKLIAELETAREDS